LEEREVRTSLEVGMQHSRCLWIIATLMVAASCGESSVEPPVAAGLEFVVQPSNAVAEPDGAGGESGAGAVGHAVQSRADREQT
jgi:hypothetical protein